MFSSEHGPSGFDGSPGGDEINLIVLGGNYGWPLVSHDDVLEGTLKPLIQFTPAEAPASALYYSSDVMPFFTGSLFFGALRGEGLIQLVFSEVNSQNLEVERVEKIITDVGRVRDVVAGPDGAIYFTTSNRDGRGQVRDGDDHLYRIYPDLHRHTVAPQQRDADPGRVPRERPAGSAGNRHRGSRRKRA